jgi:hypothetical protein
MIGAEELVGGPDGTTVPLTKDGTMPIAEIRSHAGIVRVRRDSFDMS